MPVVALIHHRRYESAARSPVPAFPMLPHGSGPRRWHLDGAFAHRQADSQQEQDFNTLLPVLRALALILGPEFTQITKRTNVVARGVRVPWVCGRVAC